tara:strand:- start:1224 stop:1550 length:327 start_codon:yes stop_codon:yes gene_type:complete
VAIGIDGYSPVCHSVQLGDFSMENQTFDGCTFIVFSGEKTDDGKAVIALRTRHANRVGYGAVAYLKSKDSVTQVASYLQSRGLDLYARGQSKSGNSLRFGILNMKTKA